jgi:hypothetical protein
MAYVTLQEFKDSPFYCAYASCCTATDLEIDAQITGLILSCQSIIDNYINTTLEEKERKDIFEGDNSSSYFLEHIPVLADPVPTIAYKKLVEEFYENTAPAVTGTITDFEIEDETTGLIRSNIIFKRKYIYTVEYSSGFEVIPEDMKQAMYMFILNMSQRIDFNNMSNADITVDRISVDKVQSTSFGNAKNVKNIVVKNMLDINSIPLHVLSIINKYKVRY